ncbi:Myb-like DNA-binding domain containing protein [Trichomonas vaginalis G3]|uniref:Myb-like DNA-binding domain containing protein n=1 Tax=Trichomonas vaginalis (strain ATCC PRA-98 / G3) TaxID=412133 RepID=A2H2U0_TRIV3|nr:RNA polymerase II transcription regulator recruiting protein [Trichomonas vaginalis G3]EAX76277.1 Myb-like DNA-binding domain containing protein [Trichomonas vaginalis G3]KAI5508015.1 RNA polymerase II transcription regulator recruiting protein [Trichomonas vaginalis G3]|eukprot:XP_001289207.1 Myb-like DNA-binding domain containing protein [Trichomonas vaginalis G3]
MGNRNGRQCKDRWTKYLNPNINTQEFSIDEDIKLLTLYEQFGSKWVLISKFFNNRSDVAIKSRFQVLRRRGITKQVLHLSQFQSKSQLAMMYLRNEAKPSHKTTQRKAKQEQFTLESSSSDASYSPLDTSITTSPIEDQFFTNFDQFDIPDILF